MGANSQRERVSSMNDLAPGAGRGTELEDLKVRRVGNDVDESVVYTSLQSGWAFKDVFQFFVMLVYLNIRS